MPGAEGGDTKSLHGTGNYGETIMQTNTLTHHRTKRDLCLTVNGYTKDSRGDAVVQVYLDSGLTFSFYLTPDEARTLAAAMDAAATAADLPE